MASSPLQDGSVAADSDATGAAYHSVRHTLTLPQLAPALVLRRRSSGTTSTQAGCV
jgi:hypothetical protein